jgi:hypothetical protein
MKVLKIEKSQGYFLSTDEYKPVDKLGKDDLLKLVDMVLAGDIEVDPYDEAELQNEAHRIIYKNVHEKLVDLGKRRAQFKDESERLFHTEYEKYKTK